MKKKLLALLLALALLSALTGCSLYETAARLDAAEERIEQRLDLAEEHLESSLSFSPDQAVLTEEEAVAIALEHAGLTQEQISHLHVQYELDDRVPEYEIEFRQGYAEYDYTIHAETGAILSFEKGD